MPIDDLLFDIILQSIDSFPDVHPHPSIASPMRGFLKRTIGRHGLGELEVALSGKLPLSEFEELEDNLPPAPIGVDQDQRLEMIARLRLRCVLDPEDLPPY